MLHKIQLQEHSRGGGTDGTLYIIGVAFNRWNDERKVNVNRNDNDWNDNWWFGGVRNSFLSLPIFWESFVL